AAGYGIVVANIAMPVVGRKISGLRRDEASHLGRRETKEIPRQITVRMAAERFTDEDLPAHDLGDFVEERSEKVVLSGGHAGAAIEIESRGIAETDITVDIGRTGEAKRLCLRKGEPIISAACRIVGRQ